MFGDEHDAVVQLDAERSGPRSHVYTSSSVYRVASVHLDRSARPIADCADGVDPGQAAQLVLDFAWSAAR